MKQKSRIRNVYAKNIKGEEKHISEVESGRKGYYCLGCDAQVDARKGEKISHYFAHAPVDVKIERKCTYSDETYRHKLAKEILQRIKEIRVPPLYKFPPLGLDDKPIKLKNAEIIKAHSVKIERQFYEDEEGNICYGHRVDFEKEIKKHLLIQPDVAFFDEEENPILLIEIIATHEIDASKLSKLKRLGINTIQVKIPKDSPERIENTFYRTQRTKWVYNHEQENTTYIPISQGSAKGILPIDKFQRKLLRAEESYECRSSQLKNLIRGFRKCLEGEQYRNTLETLRTEIKRVEGNTNRNKERLQELQRKHRKSIQKRFDVEYAVLGRQQGEFERRNKRVRTKIERLGQKYERKIN